MQTKMKPEELILTISDRINDLYKLTNDIKTLDKAIEMKLEPELEGERKNTMIRLLIRYSDLSITTQEHLLNYFKFESETNSPKNLTFHRLYRKLID